MPSVEPLLVRVYYEDTDFSGRVHHASYLRYLERGRTEWLRKLGFAHLDMEVSTGMVFVVRRLTIDYLSPAQMDDLLRVETRVSTLRGASIEFSQSIFRGEERLARAHVLVASIRGGRPARISEILRAKITSSLPRKLTHRSSGLSPRLEKRTTSDGTSSASRSARGDRGPTSRRSS